MISIARDWIEGLSGGERLLITAAAALAVILAATVFALAPLREARSDARLAYEDSASLLSEVRAGVAQAASQRGRNAPADAAGGARAAATSTAIARGLSIARVSPVDRGGLSMRLEAADPEALYAWLAELDARYGIEVRRASIRRNAAAERVEADLVLSGGGGS